MKTLLKLEELAQFLTCVVLLGMNGVPWWAYVLLAVGPDIGLIGYAFSHRTGAIVYNLFHHKGMAFLVGLIGLAGEGLNMLYATPAHGEIWLLAAVILYGHSSMDRMLGYGLKHMDDFKHTHLGWIGGEK